MSGSKPIPGGQAATNEAGAVPGPASADPSMEDILASIRRILSEDEVAAQEAGAKADEPAAAPDVFTLDSSMMVEAPPHHAEDPVPLQPVLPADWPQAQPVSAEPAPPPWRPPEPAPMPAERPAAASESLMGDAAAAAAASSVGSLLRTLATERHNVSVYRGGPTLEDLVREEMRPLLAQWLDRNLPPLVERLVRAEIERVVARALS